MNTQPFLERSRAPLAALLAFLLVVAGALTAVPAFAAGPSVSASEAPRAGGTVTVTGSGFAGTAPGVYLGIGRAGLAGFYAGSSQITDVVWIAPGNADGSSGMGRTAPMTPDGSFSVQVAVPAYSEGAQYAVYTSKAHGQGFADPSQNTTTSLEWEALPAVATATTLTVDPAGSSPVGASFTLRAGVEPAASGTITYFDGEKALGTSAVGGTLTASIPTAGTALLKAVFTPSDAAAFLGSTSAVVPYEITTPPVEPEPGVPTLSVSKTADLARTGETLTITAENYDASAASRYTTGKAGFYLQVGWISETWRPSAGAPSSARTNAYSTWVADAANPAAPTKWIDNGDGTVDVTWSVTVTAEDVGAKKIPGGTLAVFSVGAGGVVQAGAELAVPISFATAAPVLSVSQATGLEPGGQTLTITAEDFDGSAASKYTAGRAGFYFQVGWLADTWRPSDGAPSSARTNAFSTWVADAANTAAPTKWTENWDGTVDATWTVDVTKAALDAKALPAGTLAVFSVGAGGVVQAAVEHAVPISFADSETPTDPETPVDPEPPVDPGTPATPPPAAPGGGSLSWAISSSFASYITGDIAHGSIAVTGGATRAGGVFQFGQATGSTYDAATGTGTVSYNGSVRFAGHAGVLDVTIANPQVRVTSVDAATLYVTSGGSQVAFATLDLSAAVRTTANGTVTYSRVPAALTASGRSQVFQGYTTELDALTFTIGVAAAAPAGSTGTVATASATTTRTTSLPATPPAATGIELDDDVLAALRKGEPVTVSASGFAADEKGIQVVVYSTPTLLGEVTADASGTATWTGSLPATLPDGEHTLTFQGSVDRGIRFTLARAAVAAGCVVDAASLDWGFKESFRTYIEGIAAGGWELAGVAYEYPGFVWSAGKGAVDAEARTGLVTYGGSIRFTGHQGALDTTLANARVELAGDTGYLVFDVSGTTQAGEPVTAAGIRFAEFSVPDLEVTDDGLVLDALPATLTEAGAAAFGTYAAGEVLDPVSAVLPVAADCAVAPVAVEEETPVAEATEAEAISADQTAAPVWPWAVGGIALALGIGAVVWIVVTRRRATAGGSGDQTAA
ncbi:MAG TPA: HtaA domain-containing protein [Microbacterium sp.]|uniref:HtaA domain-containing protein n=1 Tax=Microbacterium sp. TaxID=51671 RepID=UPI002F91F32E